jgi:myo-inositol 2-dehydrogenase/D-chiro-inositol 1-dehydrogenase
VGLIGCGSIAQSVHLKILTRMAGVELVAFAETDPERRQQARRRAPSAVAVADYQSLLALPEVEAVLVCLPTALHAAAATAAVEAGKHLYLEKPLATSLDEARRVIDAWRNAGVVGMVGFNYRFNPLVQDARQRIQAGQIGNCIAARSVFATPARRLPAWKESRSNGGGVLLDLASHHVDLVHFLFRREIVELFAQIQSLRSEDDSATLHLRLADGVMVQSFFSLCAVDEDRVEIYGDAGKLSYDRYRSLGVHFTGASADYARLRQSSEAVRMLLRKPYSFKRLCLPGSESSYQAALAHFATAVRSSEPASPSLWDGYRSLAVIDAAEQSARSGRAVRLPDFPSSEDALSPAGASRSDRPALSRGAADAHSG